MGGMVVPHEDETSLCLVGGYTSTTTAKKSRQAAEPNFLRRKILGVFGV